MHFANLAKYMGSGAYMYKFLLLFTILFSQFINVSFEGYARECPAEEQITEKKYNVEQTLSIIKPHAMVKKDDIILRIEKAGFRIVKSKTVTLTKEQAYEFYAEHEGKPFFEPLVKMMSSGPILVQVLEGGDAILKYRKLVGVTDSREAEKGTLRAEFGQDERYNAVHASSNLDDAKQEIDFFNNL